MVNVNDSYPQELQHPSWLQFTIADLILGIIQWKTSMTPTKLGAPTFIGDFIAVLTILVIFSWQIGRVTTNRRSFLQFY